MPLNVTTREACHLGAKLAWTSSVAPVRRETYYWLDADAAAHFTTGVTCYIPLVIHLLALLKRATKWSWCHMLRNLAKWIPS